MEKQPSRGGGRTGISGVRKNSDVPQLSCELCRERKVKCDKREPCSNCVSARAVCIPVYRLRRPRGRHAPQSPAIDEDLRTRIRRLEALISDAGPVARSQSDDIALDTPANASQATTTSPANGTQTGKRALLVQQPDHFWTDLAEEISGLRDVIESEPNEAEDDTAQEPEPVRIVSRHRDIGLLGLADGANSPSFIPHGIGQEHSATPENRALDMQLCQVYLQQVDPIFKILHRPSLEKFLIGGGAYLGYPLGHPSVEALRSAVLYLAMISMTENQCQAMFREKKSTLVANFRRSCESSMEKSGLLTTRDITVLQAFVLYLAARRSEERTRAVWTLLATAVRIAKGLSLNLDPEKQGRRETFFVQQIRRRLWLTICLMDVQASFGLASQPIISLREAMSSSTLPSHINDSDFDPSTTHYIPDRKGLTDTTYAIVKYKLQLLGRLTNFSAQEGKTDDDALDGGRRSNTTGGTPSSAGDTLDFDSRQQHSEKFEQEILQLLHLCDPESSTYAWFTLHSAQCFVAGARACVLRPLQRLPEGSQPPPPRAKGDTELLSMAARVLEKAMLMHTDPRGEGFRWSIVVPWHALAIAIAECYICPDADLARRVWPTIEASYQHHEAIIARFRGGKLHGPLGKLMARAREKLAPLIQSSEVAELHAAALGPATDASNTLPPQLALTLTPVSLTDEPLLSGLSSHSLGPATIDAGQSWDIWDEFISEISFDQPSGFDVTFFDNQDKWLEA